MKVHIERVDMKRDEDNHFIGHTVFGVEGHKELYEVTFLSKRGKDWDYSINFAKEPGIEEELFEVDTALEQDDEFFDLLLDAALDSMEPSDSE